MGEYTGIAWTHRTQNCIKHGPGCLNCYMYSEKIRYGQDPTVVVRSKPPTFNAPLKWEKELAASGARALVFTCSWSDFFIDKADAWRAEAWDVIRRTPHCTYQILTKRHGRIVHHLPRDWGDGWPNVWLGVTVENRAALRRLDVLREIPARVRFTSFEPLLEDLGAVDLAGIAWSIIGGESGSDARPCAIEWARSLVRQCRAQGSAPFVKQLGARPIESDRVDVLNERGGVAYVRAPSDPDGLLAEARAMGRGTRPHLVALRARKGDDPAEWPADLRCQEFPEVAHVE